MIRSYNEACDILTKFVKCYARLDLGTEPAEYKATFIQKGNSELYQIQTQSLKKAM
jgi:nitrate reductase assembly molybdenum cofactor insertion protein NarJ